MWRRLKTYFLTGLVVLIPLVLTVYIIWKLFYAIDGLLRGVVTNVLERFGIPISSVGLGFISVILLILLTGLIAKNYFGRKLIQLGELIFARIPLINRIYRAIQQISNAFFSERREVFKKAVLIEYPRKGVYSLAFLTQDTKGEVQDRLSQDMVSVFLPTTPNPTSGFLLFVPKRDVIEMNMSIEEALKLVISGGVIAPESITSSELKVIKEPERIEIFGKRLDAELEND
ncbi:MAG: DUF502 domain-containing protein [candidate division KSB1 bacterium]|nr:DUF502 domain-containing protein [candidate division KSB1 bacterium]MDZ7334709.1 DUF502 domain-containing protein [candidate division KSB1 bacterium]MDZ7356213.1 DUF502 domain-containing protein [candidate division KSB1 bacterium]MDZ7400356.1 DUF502 domain-containing protein [candidate division KSB1 bacterium]